MLDQCLILQSIGSCNIPAFAGLLRLRMALSICYSRNPVSFFRCVPVARTWQNLSTC